MMLRFRSGLSDPSEQNRESSHNESVNSMAENGRQSIGKGQQLKVDSEDFPTLARTGLHSEKELARTRTITGKPVDEITALARPRQSSDVGFISEEEDIISVMIGDNRLVQNLRLTHPKLAKPLYHVWNLLLMEYRLGHVGRRWDNLEYILYNNRKVFITASGTKGFQESIFDDEIKGTFDIHIWRELDKTEKAFLRQKYPHLSQKQMDKLINKLCRIHFGEMEPYYIMRYGFYEGHTGYRVDPIALALVFGFKSLKEIEHYFI